MVDIKKMCFSCGCQPYCSDGLDASVVWRDNAMEVV